MNLTPDEFRDLRAKARTKGIFPEGKNPMIAVPKNIPLDEKLPQLIGSELLCKFAGIDNQSYKALIKKKENRGSQIIVEIRPDADA